VILQVPDPAERRELTSRAEVGLRWVDCADELLSPAKNPKLS